MKRNSKKTQKEFVTKCTAILTNLGAVPVDNARGYNLVVETKIGPLYLRVDDNSILFSVYGNFIGNEKEAADRFGHWKQNVHCSDGVSDALAEVKYFYSKIIND